LIDYIGEEERRERGKERWTRRAGGTPLPPKHNYTMHQGETIIQIQIRTPQLITYPTIQTKITNFTVESLQINSNPLIKDPTLFLLKASKGK
jgi:hypothetical protein